ncbi:Uncharacterised protein [Shigella sonnei]|nr:Uncharacterised protein [Shigella sonnei]CTD30435.1 Uncharacterised protein [Shigella sonnei]
MPLQRSESSSCRPLHRGFSPQWTFPMGARLPPHGAAVRGRTQNFLPGSWLKILWPVHLTLDRWNGRGLRLPPGKSTAGNRPQGWRQEGRLLRHQAQFPHTPSGVQGAQVTARQGRRDRGGATGTVAASRVFTHRTVAAARNRASGFGGDWRVRQQLPVGVGPDDRMPPGSREPKWAQ